MKKRVYYLDWLRVIATVMVVTIHVSSGFVSNNLHSNPKTYWFAANFFESISRQSVPLFVMISGALLLSSSRDFSYYEFIQRRVGKIFIPLVGWSFIYYSYRAYRGDHYDFFSIAQFIKLFVTNGVSIHFWFMYLILGIYLTTPIIRVFIKNASKKDIEYFLILWFYASFIVKFMNYHFGFSLNIELFLVTNYVGYFILGYYLANLELNSNWKIYSFALGILGIVTTFLLTYFGTVNKDGALEEFWYEYHSPNVLLSAIGLFLFLKLTFSTKPLPLLFEKLNTVSFGVYLVHILVLQVFSNEIFDYIKNTVHPVFSIPINVLIVVLISGVSSYFISKVPLFKKLVP